MREPVHADLARLFESWFLFDMQTSFERLLGFVWPRRRRIAILDDLFPHPISGFRFEEFLCYLKKCRECQYTPTAMRFLWLERLARSRNSSTGTLQRILITRGVYFACSQIRFRGGGILFIFLNNIEMHLRAIERAQKPFASPLTLAEDLKSTTSNPTASYAGCVVARSFGKSSLHSE